MTAIHDLYLYCDGICCVQDENGIERTWGDVETKKKYSHIDLIHMIDGFDGERGAATAGGRGYYLKVMLELYLYGIVCLIV